LKKKPIQPGPGQESVWDYPRPPRIEESSRHILVLFEGERIAETRRALRVLETSHPPVYYIQPEDIRMEFLRPETLNTFCEWKGRAAYYSLEVKGRVSKNAAWYYPQPFQGYEKLKDMLAFYPGRVDACYLDGERVEPQPGDFYGGWVTSQIVGPFKGGPGTLGW
jgi:uncharacterized protein (DUF427 family)